MYSLRTNVKIIVVVYWYDFDNSMYYHRQQNVLKYRLSFLIYRNKILFITYFGNILKTLKTTKTQFITITYYYFIARYLKMSTKFQRNIQKH